MCAPLGPSLSVHPKPYFPPQLTYTQQTAPKPISGSSPSTSPKLHDLSLPPPFPLPHVSIIQETPGRFQPPSQPSTPEGGFSPGGSPAKVPESGGRPSLRDDGSPPSLGVSIKEEPQELDQMYLDDGE